jgi:GNAT superfamily N-acetyltransferase
VTEPPVIPAGRYTLLPVPAGHIATVVTYLEMHAPPAGRAAPPAAGLTLDRMAAGDLDRYRRLIRAVGEDWLWFSRLRLDDAALAAIVGDPGVEVYAAVRGGAEIGILELDRRDPADVELAFFGLVAGAVGRGIGRWLIGRAIDLAWRPETRRFWVHTCTLDHPSALGFYRAAGFRPYAVALEAEPDPRLDGTLRRDAASHIPVIERAR